MASLGAIGFYKGKRRKKMKKEKKPGSVNFFRKKSKATNVPAPKVAGIVSSDCNECFPPPCDCGQCICTYNCGHNPK